ncbi:MAG: hypothetical protein SFW66_10455 [Gammaproteobacteria bacterium]|nr:hypothetical protein [Gammaproteobacteria bacterium]
MKKVILLALVSLMLPTTAVYATDLGGVIIKGITGSNSSTTQDQNGTHSGNNNSSSEKEAATLLLA